MIAGVTKINKLQMKCSNAAMQEPRPLSKTAKNPTAEATWGITGKDLSDERVSRRLSGEKPMQQRMIIGDVTFRENCRGLLTRRQSGSLPPQCRFVSIPNTNTRWKITNWTSACTDSGSRLHSRRYDREPAFFHFRSFYYAMTSNTNGCAYDCSVQS